MEMQLSLRSYRYLLVNPYVTLRVLLVIKPDGYHLSVRLDQDAFIHESSVKLPLEYDSRGKHNASRSVHCLIIHAFIGDCPYRGMRIGDRVPSPQSFSHSVLVQIHSEIFIVPNNCGAMQFPVGKLAETLEGMMFVLRFELTEPLSHRIDAFSFIVC